MIRLALALTICLTPAIASAASTQQRDGGEDARTGGMGAGTRATHSIPRPGTDMETAGSGPDRNRSGAEVDTHSGRATAPNRQP